jgi:hypothetical protein
MRRCTRAPGVFGEAAGTRAGGEGNDEVVANDPGVAPLALRAGEAVARDVAEHSSVDGDHQSRPKYPRIAIDAT